MSSTAPSISIDPLARADMPVVRRLAHAIWHEVYPAIISREQIDVMLAGRCSDAALGGVIDATDRWFDLLRVAGEPVGYCSCASHVGNGVLKLEQLYLLAAHRGRGLGRLMLDRVERRGRDASCTAIELQVNKRNAPAIAFYRRAGFTLREEGVFDIGGGFVMDDFIMAKALA